MNRLHEAVVDLMANLPSNTSVTDLRKRVRRRRRRHALAIIGLACVISAASVAVAASLGHKATGPSIAVSPTSGSANGRKLGHALTASDVSFGVFHRPPDRLPASFLASPGSKVLPGGFDATIGARLVLSTPEQSVYLLRSNRGAYCIGTVTATFDSFGSVACTTAAGLAKDGISFAGSLSPDRKSIDGVGMAPDFVTRIRVNDTNIPIRNNAFRITVRFGDTVIITTPAGDLTMPIRALARRP